MFIRHSDIVFFEVTVKRAQFSTGLSFLFDLKQLLKYPGYESLVRYTFCKYFLYSLACLCTILLVFVDKLVFYVSLHLGVQLFISTSQWGHPISSGPSLMLTAACALSFRIVSLAGCFECHWISVQSPVPVLPKPAPSQCADLFPSSGTFHSSQTPCS